DHREDQNTAARDQPRDDRRPLLLRRDAARQGREEPAAVRGESSSRRAGDADADQPGLDRVNFEPRKPVAVATRLWVIGRVDRSVLRSALDRALQLIEMIVVVPGQ